MTATTWKDRALAATRCTKTGAILRCALGVDRKELPRFTGKASITSDSFVMCNFVDRDGDGHPGAFVGSFEDVWRNINGLSIHLKLGTTDHAELVSALMGWFGSDYRDAAAQAKR